MLTSTLLKLEGTSRNVSLLVFIGKLLLQLGFIIESSKEKLYGLCLEKSFLGERLNAMHLEDDVSTDEKDGHESSFCSDFVLGTKGLGDVGLEE
jgi:hypothetical protein